MQHRIENTKTIQEKIKKPIKNLNILIIHILKDHNHQSYKFISLKLLIKKK